MYLHKFSYYPLSDNWDSTFLSFRESFFLFLFRAVAHNWAYKKPARTAGCEYLPNFAFINRRK